MNHRGQVYLMALIVAVIIFAFGFLILNFLKEPLNEARNAIGCETNDLTDGTKVVCLGLDLVFSYWILLVISAAGGVISSQILT